MDDLKRITLEGLTVTNKDCPCRFCKPPKRNGDCHGSCERYKTWNNKHVEELTTIREEKEKQNLTSKNR